ncbi:MAG: DUF5302 domain-containing protein [bacterium]
MPEPTAPRSSTEPEDSSEANAKSDEDTSAAPAGDRSDLRSAFREALARKSARNSHPESHLDGRTIGGGSNDTRKRQFRRKSG